MQYCEENRRDTSEIADAGLVHLKGLTNLEVLWLGSNITDAGVAELKKALPDCEIIRP